MVEAGGPARIRAVGSASAAEGHDLYRDRFEPSYVREQLGHADVAVAARNYARWVGGSEYREPMQLAPGELPADLSARLERRHPDPTGLEDERSDSVSPRNEGRVWGERGDLNPRPPGSQPGALTN
jgi:hypothetical protein